MASSTIQCPACGSRDVTTSHENATVNVPYADPVEYSQIVHTCSICGESGDFANSNHSTLKEAEKVAEKDAVENILAFLNAHGQSQAYIERALGLPQRTLQRWKAGECSAASIALLQLVRTYPWTLEVAEARFAEPVASQRLVMASAVVLSEFIAGTKAAFVVCGFAQNADQNVVFKQHIMPSKSSMELAFRMLPIPQSAERQQ
ncbi:MAG TPA: hypothetical protein VGL61_04510 [Kofleriaceae bacterium]|jgi:transcriptional regulator with XRE-family HTH domain